jgi:reticulon-4-interacting protein 1, mitochondrial
VPRRKPAADEVEVAVEAAAVNPIDVRRAEGYGLRLLSLLGAGRFPMVLGNDFAGTIAAAGSRVSILRPGDRVYGLRPTSAHGSHASYVVVKSANVLPAPAGSDLQALAAMPYSFVTMRRAVRGAGLTRENAAGNECWCMGVAGGLGRLALQMLSGWGAKITAIARPATMAACLQAGAAKVLDASKQPFVSLDRTFDATLNFATWEDDLDLVHCLRKGALGHATTVHPMLGNFDRYGWTRGALRSFSEKKKHRAALPKAREITHGFCSGQRRRRYRTWLDWSNSGISAYPLPSAKHSRRPRRHSITSRRVVLAERSSQHDSPAWHWD